MAAQAGSFQVSTEELVDASLPSLESESELETSYRRGSRSDDPVDGWNPKQPPVYGAKTL